jgi:hypothetical protein
MTTNLSSSKTDKIFSVIKATSELFPVTGALTTLIDEFIPSELNRRRDSLLLKLEEDFKNMQDKINKDVVSKPYFISVFLQSFKSAMATEQQEKIDCYRAIILNTLIEQEPNIDEIQIMIRITDSLTPLHIKLIKLFRDPQEYLNQNPDVKVKIDHVRSGGIGTLTSAVFPEYEKKLIEVALKDLTNRGIGNGLEGGGTMSIHGILSPRLTDFGKKYLQFITHNGN